MEKEANLLNRTKVQLNGTEANRPWIDVTADDIDEEDEDDLTIAERVTSSSVAVLDVSVPSTSEVLTTQLEVLDELD